MNTARELAIESIEFVQARGCAGAGSTRLDETNRLVVVRDQMVAGVAGGDHKTAAEVAVFGGEDQRDGFKMQSIDLRGR